MAKSTYALELKKRKKKGKYRYIKNRNREVRGLLKAK